ncbi:MAG: hypothetical protein ABH878_08130 [bacterium]
MVFSRIRPRSFHYMPRFLQKGDEEGKRITFQRKTSYDPHQSRTRTFSLLILVIIVSLIIWYLIPRLVRVNPDKTKIYPQDHIEIITDN